MFEAFKVGVSISLINHVSHGLSLMSRDFMRTEADAAKLESRIKSIQGLALKGALAMGAGAAGLMLLKGPYEEAKKLAQAQANFATLNLTAMENAQAFGKAATMSHQILGTTITGNVKLIHDLHTAFGDLHHALGTADMFAKMSFVAKVANGGKDVDGLTNAAAKALEHRGGKVLNDPARFEAEGDMMTKVMLATKMRVSPLDYLTASGTGKMAYQLFDPEFLYGNFAGMMAINGGARTGTAAMTAFSSLVGGHMDSKGKGFLADIGLYQEGFSKHRLKLMHDSMAGMSPEERRIAIASMGGQAAIAGGLSDANAELYAHRPDVFLAKVMVPAIKKRFGMDLSDEQIGLILARHFNRNTGDFLGTQVTMAQKLSKDTNIINKSMGFAEAREHFLKSPEGAEEAASAAWKNFLTMFGSVYLPAITRGMLKLAGILDSLGQAVERHPTITKIIAYGVGIVSTVLLLGGAFAIVGAAVGGLTLAFGIVGGTGLGLVAALALAAAGVGTLVWALKDLWDANHHDGVKLSAGAQARLNDPRLKDMDKDFHTVRPRGSDPVQVTSVVKLNEREIARAVTMHQETAANKPQGGSRWFDSGMAPPPVNFSPS